MPFSKHPLHYFLEWGMRWHQWRSKDPVREGTHVQRGPLLIFFLAAALGRRISIKMKFLTCFKVKQLAAGIIRRCYVFQGDDSPNQ